MSSSWKLDKESETVFVTKAVFLIIQRTPISNGIAKNI